MHRVEAAVGTGVHVGSGVQVGTAVGWTGDTCEPLASTVAGAGAGAGVGVGSAVQAANRATKASSSRFFLMQ